MEQKGIGAVIAIVIVIIVAAAAAGAYILTKGDEGAAPGEGGGEGEEAGGLPLYSGSTSWEIPAELAENLLVFGEGVETAAYSVENVSVQDLVDWYKDQMTDWTLENETVGTPPGAPPEVVMGMLMFSKDSEGAIIRVFSGLSEANPSWPEDTCYILHTGSASEFEQGGEGGENEGGTGGETGDNVGVENLPLYSGSTSWEIPTELDLPSFGEGLETAAYSVENVSVQDLVDWYKDQMTDWTLETENVGTPPGAPPEMTTGTIMFTKNGNGALIVAFSGLSAMNPSWPEDTCYVLCAGTASEFGSGG